MVVAFVIALIDIYKRDSKKTFPIISIILIGILALLTIIQF